MTRPRLVLAVLLGACNSSPNLDILDQNVFAAPDDPLVTFDNAAHPQIVGIQKFSGGKCTGTIIASNKVLTAAHCFGLNTPASNVDVLLDRNTSEALQDSLLALGDPAIHNDTNGLTWEVASIAIHPAWSSNDDFD